MYKYCFYLLSLALFSGCSYHTGNITTAPEGDNFVYLEQAIGQTKSFKLFGIGGFTREALVYEAKKQLFRNRPLAAGEAYANFAVDFKTTFFWFYEGTKVTLTADVISYTQNPEARHAIGLSQAEISKYNFKRQAFLIGDTVYTISLKPYLIEGYTHNGLLVTRLNKRSYKTKILNYDKCYFTNNQKRKLLGRLNQSASNVNAEPLFAVGDTLLDENGEKKILLAFGQNWSFTSSNTPFISGGKKGRLLYNISPSNLGELFSTGVKTRDNLTLGQKVKYDLSTFTVVGFNKTRVLIKDSYRNYETPEYAKVFRGE